MAMTIDGGSEAVSEPKQQGPSSALPGIQAKAANDSTAQRSN